MKKLVVLIGVAAIALSLPEFGQAQRRKEKKEAAAKEAAAADSAAKAAADSTKAAAAKAADTAKAAPAAAAATGVAAVAVADTTKPAQDTLAKKDTVVVAAAPPKDCFQEWYEKFRARGAKQVTNGEHPVIITLKSEAGSVCLVGKATVENGMIKPPVLVQNEDGEYTTFSSVGKKLDPALVSAMQPEELYAIKDGMSITFRTSNQEYGRIIFYTFANKANKVNKTAPNPDELLKEQ